MFDLNTLDTLTASEEGRWFYPAHPRTGAPFTMSNGEKFGFLLYGRASQASRDAMREMNDARAVIEQTGGRVSVSQSEDIVATYMARCTKAWTPIMLDGVEVPYTFENAKKIWADPRFGWMRPLAQAFISDDGGFFPA